VIALLVVEIRSGDERVHFVIDWPWIIGPAPALFAGLTGNGRARRRRGSKSPGRFGTATRLSAVRQGRPGPRRGHEPERGRCNTARDGEDHSMKNWRPFLF
jgi:hypothetical protein